MLWVTAETLAVLVIVSAVAAHLAAAVLEAVVVAAGVGVDGQDYPLSSVLAL